MTLPREGHRLAGLSRPALALLVFWAIVLLAGGALAIWVVAWPGRSGLSAAGAPGVAAHSARTAPAPPSSPPPSKPVSAVATAALPSNPHHWPQVAVIVGGIGLARAPSEEAIDSLPAGVTLAFSPYAETPQALVDRARARGHEVVLSLPMEPEGAPRNDEGDHQLSLAKADSVNAAEFDWALGRLRDYDGVTNAESGQYGGHFATTSGFAAISGALDRHDLAYFTTLAPLVAPRRMLLADLTLSDDDDAPTVDAALARLETVAETKGCALGIAGAISPVLTERLRVWSNALPARGVLLLPAAAMLPDGPAPCPAATAVRPAAEPISPTPPATDQHD